MGKKQLMNKITQSFSDLNLFQNRDYESYNSAMRYLKIGNMKNLLKNLFMH